MPSIKAFFSIAYRTSFGEEVYVCGSLDELGAWDPQNAVKLNPNSDFTNWTLLIDVKKNCSFEFKFLIKNASTGYVKWEEQENRSFQAKLLLDKPYSFPEFDSLYFRCFWQPLLSPGEAVQEKTSAFKHVIFRKTLTSPAVPDPADIIIEFRVKVFRVRPDSQVVVFGNIGALGNGNPLKGVRLNPISTESSIWHAFISIPASVFSKLSSFQYNYVIIDSDKRVVQELSARTFEALIELPSTASSDTSSKLTTYTFIKLADSPFMYGSTEDWKGAGVAIPVFSLRSEQSLGVGEFLDIKLMADWLSASGFRMLQILPINDTRTRGDWRDSYPYSPVSSYALHPLYLNVERLDLTPKLKELVQAKKTELNKLPTVDYEKVLDLKLQVVHEVFLRDHAKIVVDQEFQEFISEKDNKYWLQPYALFLYYQSQHGTADFYQWPPHHRNLSKEEIEGRCEERQESLLETYWIQYNLHLQLSEAIRHATQRRVLVKGDLPIGVSPMSVDAWSNPHLFRLNFAAGAPPDYFTSDGQNWGFPTYDWEAMKKENYLWWRMRLHQMAKYFQAYRIDHILGFFRIWEIPAGHVQGLLGRFQPSLPLWKDELEHRGLWDFRRYCDPYIRQYHVDQLPANVRDHFLVQGEGGVWRFKDEYKTEAGIEKDLHTGEDTGKFIKQLADGYRQQLFNLLRNVVLIQDPEDQNKFYPRIECFKTDSYHSLDDYAKREFFELYNDYYFRRQDEFWTSGAMEKLPMMMTASDMMVCGEDLGMVPACVPGVLHRLNILCLRIERMPAELTSKISQIRDFPYMSVCTPSVHDTSNLRAWWEEDGELRQWYWNHVLSEGGEAPPFCEPWIVKKIIENHLYSASMWTIFTIQDLFGMFPEYRVADPKSETINIPAIKFHYWRYRMHVNLEKLIADDSINKSLHSMLESSQRVYDY